VHEEAGGEKNWPVVAEDEPDRVQYRLPMVVVVAGGWARSGNSDGGALAEQSWPLYFDAATPGALDALIVLH